MFLRFVINQNDPDSHRRQGLFQAIVSLEDADALDSNELARCAEIVKWFNDNLPTPSRFARSAKYHAKNVALSWFRDTAIEHLAKMYEIKHILNDHGITVSVIRIERPGYIVYEDKYQVVAEPFKETVT